MVRSLGKFGRRADEGAPANYGDEESAGPVVNSTRPSDYVAPTGTMKLGTFKGVFIPTLQNILGVILFLRVPFIVGQAGIFQALCIVWLSCLTATLTSLSMSAVATNGVLKGGGCYSIIKNSLGPQFGGVTGILLFLANTFGVAMYVLGCVEILNQAYPTVFEPINDRLLGLLVLAALGSIVFIGIKYISRFAVIFMAGVVMAILSLWLGVIRYSIGGGKPNHDVVGLSWNLLASNWGARYQGTWDFASCLAVFYPAMTDPLAGSNLSGDLRDPQRSIPPGTLAAVAAATVVFTIQIVLVAGGTVRRAELRADYFIVQYIAYPFEECAIIGVLLSTLGAGLQSLAGAPRLLAALGRDQLIPALWRFAPATPDSEPRAALLLCVSLSGLCVLINDLNLVAPLITMWFMSCYTIINFACAWLAYERTPSFRPSFRYFDWRVSAFGVVLNLVLMFFMSWYYAIGALTIALVLYKYIERQVALEENSGVNRVWDDDDDDALAFVDDDDDDDEETNKKMPMLHEEPASAETNNDDTNSQRRARTVAAPVTTAMAMATATLRKGNKVGGGAADWRSGLRFAQARLALLHLEERDLQFKYWRPFVLFLCRLDEVGGVYAPQRGMINLLAQLMKRSKGLTLVNGVITSTAITRTAVHRARKARRDLRNMLAEREVKGFADVVIAESSLAGQRVLVQAKGLGYFRPNTVLVGWPSEVTRRDPGRAADFAAIVEDAATLGKSVLVCAGLLDFPDRSARCYGRIDVWWVFDLFPAGGLLLLLPFLLMKSKVWNHASLRLVVVTAREDDDDNQALDKAMRAMLRAGGVIADVIVLHVRLADAPRYAGRKAIVEHVDPAKTTGNDLNAGIHDKVASNPGFETMRPKIFESRPSIHHLDFEKGTKEIGDPLRPSKLTALIAEQSGDSDLIFISLPRRDAKNQPATEWLQSVDTMIEPLKRVVFVLESGKEKVQFVQ